MTFYDMLNAVGAFFLMVLVGMTIQNSVFARALNISRLVSLVGETADTLIFGTLLCVVNVLSSIMYYFIHTLVLRALPYAVYVRPLAMVLCMSVAFFIVFVITVKFASYEHLARAVQVLPAASFNCTVIGTLLISTISQFSIWNMIAFGLGSSIGFVLAVLLTTEGQRKLQNRSMPAAFRGLPATLLFIAGLAMAVYGLTGHSFFS